eukprot:s2574_g2.t1
MQFIACRPCSTLWPKPASLRCCQIDDACRRRRGTHPARSSAGTGAMHAKTGGGEEEGRGIVAERCRASFRAEQSGSGESDAACALLLLVSQEADWMLALPNKFLWETCFIHGSGQLDQLGLGNDCCRRQTPTTLTCLVGHGTCNTAAPPTEYGLSLGLGAHGFCRAMDDAQDKDVDAKLDALRAKLAQLREESAKLERELAFRAKQEQILKDAVWERVIRRTWTTSGLRSSPRASQRISDIMLFGHRHKWFPD